MFFDRHESGERVLLVHCKFSASSLSAHNDATHPSMDPVFQTKSASNLVATDVDNCYPACPEEFIDLARSAGLEVVELITARRA